MTNLVAITVRATDVTDWAKINETAAKAGSAAADSFNEAFRLGTEGTVAAAGEASAAGTEASGARAPAGAARTAESSAGSAGAAGAGAAESDALEDTGAIAGDETGLLRKLESYAATPGGIGILGTGGDTSLLSNLKRDIAEAGESGDMGLLSGESSQAKSAIQAAGSAAAPAGGSISTEDVIHPTVDDKDIENLGEADAESYSSGFANVLGNAPLFEKAGAGIEKDAETVAEDSGEGFFSKFSNMLAGVANGGMFSGLGNAAEKEGESSGEGFLSKFKSVLMGGDVLEAALGAGMVAGAAYLGSKFQSAMTMLVTQAGVAKSALGGLETGVLNLAGQVGFSPDSLADALYHIESSFASVGITGPKALDLLKIAAEGAATGHANLTDVTNALDAAIVSGIPGVQNFGQAMGTLNAIVGSGDMKMQDLADAFGTGLLATVKGFGVTLNDVGAALATFGDNNIRGAKAGSELRMAIQALGAPGTGPVATAALDSLGLSYNSLTVDMQKGGLKLAITDLAKHMSAVGDTGDKVGEVLTEAFGKKAGSGINILISQEDRFLGKYPAMEKGANSFANSWAMAKDTISQKLKDLESGFEALATRVGMALLPAISSLLGYISGAIPDIEKFTDAFIKIASPVVGAFFTGLGAIFKALTDGPMKYVTAGVLAIVAAYELWQNATKIMIALDAILDATNPWIAIGVGLVILVGLIVKYHKQIVDTVEKAWDAITDFVKMVWDKYKGIIELAMLAIGTIITGGLLLYVAAIIKYHTQILDFIERTWDAVKNAVSGTWDEIYSDTIGRVEKLVQGIEDAFTGGFDSWWKSHGTEVEDVWHTVWAAVADIFKTAWGIVMSIVTPALTLLVDIFKTALSVITTVLKAAWDVITALFNIEFDVITDAAKASWAVISGVFKVALDAITVVLKTAWDVLVVLFQTSFGVITGVAKAAWDVITAAVKLAWATIEVILKTAWDVIVGLLDVFLDLVTGHWSEAWTDVRSTVEEVWNNLKSYFSSVLNAIESLMAQVWNSIKSTTSSVWNSILNGLKSIWSGLKSGFSDAVTAVKNTWNTLEGIFKTPVNFLINTVYTNGIERLWNDTIAKLGGPSMPNVGGLSSGGLLPGFGGGDVLPALLEPGEAVIDKHRTRKYASVLAAMGVPGFGGGGIIGGALSAIGHAAGDVGSFVTGTIGKVIDAGKIAAALASGNETALVNALSALLGSKGAGGAAGDLISVMTSAPGHVISAAVKAVWTALLSTVKSGASKSGSAPAVGGAESAGLITVAKYLLAHGANKAAAAGVTGVVAGESGGQPEILEGGVGPGAGLLQWTPESSAGPYQPIITGNVGKDMATQLADMMGYISGRGGLGSINAAGSPMAAADVFSRMEAPLVPGSDIVGSIVSQMYASGLASGGATAPGWSVVGEQGRELMKVPGGATVYPHGATEGMLGGGGLGPGSGGTFKVELAVDSSAAVMKDLISLIKAHVRVNGGLTKVLGP